MLVGAFEIHHGIVAAVDLALDAGEVGKCLGPRARRRGCEPESNQTSRMSSTFFHSVGFVVGRRGSAAVAPVAYQASAPSCFERLDDALVDARVVEDLDRAVAGSRTKTAIGTPQARWREITQSGRLSIMPVMRFSPARGTQRVALIASSARWRSVSPVFALPLGASDILVHRDEPLRRVAEDHRLLRAPGMRILMLEPAARDQHAGVDQRLDHGLVGVALLALVGEHALAGEARRLLGERAVLIDRVGDRGVDSARCELAAFAIQTSKSSRP